MSGNGKAAMTTFETSACIVCHKSSNVELETEKLKRWIAGEHVQNVWPEKSPDQREILITGIHPKCWNEIFGGGE